jgi:hypothetical protein
VELTNNYDISLQMYHKLSPSSTNQMTFYGVTILSRQQEHSKFEWCMQYNVFIIQKKEVQISQEHSGVWYHGGRCQCSYVYKQVLGISAKSRDLGGKIR